MNHLIKFKFAAIIIAVLLAFLSSCKSSEATLTPSFYSSEPHSTNFSSVTPTQPKPTSTFSPTLNITPQPTKTSTSFPTVTSTQLPIPPITDHEVLSAFYINHHLLLSLTKQEITFDEFLSNVNYQRDDIDIRGDRKEEIILTGSYPINNWSFFALYSLDTGGKITEICFLEDYAMYHSDVQFEHSSPYIFVDFLSQWGGTGSLTTNIDRSIIRCSEKCDHISFTYFSESFAGVSVADPSYAYSSITKSTPVISGNEIEIQTIGYSSKTTSNIEKMCDPSGQQYQSRIATELNVLKLRTYTKYNWENGRFTETEYREVPGFEITGNDTYSEYIPLLIESSLSSNELSPSLELNAYFDFFGVPQSDRNKLSLLRCSEVGENTKWYPKSIPTTFYFTGDRNLFAAVNSECNLVVGEQLNFLRPPLLSDVIFLGRENLTGCNPHFISFQWLDFTGNATPELIITTGFSDQKLWIFTIDPNVKSIYQVSGIAHGQDMIGLQIEKLNDSIMLEVGLPYHRAGCLNAIECFSLDKDYDKYIWDEVLKSFSFSR